MIITKDRGYSDEDLKTWLKARMKWSAERVHMYKGVRRGGARELYIYFKESLELYRLTYIRLFLKNESKGE